jgi:hypothetical protein
LQKVTVTASETPSTVFSCAVHILPLYLEDGDNSTNAVVMEVIGFWRHVDLQVGADVSEKHAVFIFRD